jgi:hypothetical protein
MRDKPGSIRPVAEMFCPTPRRCGRRSGVAKRLRVQGNIVCRSQEAITGARVVSVADTMGQPATGVDHRCSLGKVAEKDRHCDASSFRFHRIGNERASDAYSFRKQSCQREWAGNWFKLVVTYP